MSEKNRYNNTKIYKLVDKINQFYYIGSTTDLLCKRLYQHKISSNRKQEQKVYKYFNSIGWDNAKIILIEELCLKNRNEQMREENRHIEMYIKDEKCLNSIRSFQSEEAQKEYKEKLEQRKSEIFTCECGVKLNKSRNRLEHIRSNKHREFMTNKIEEDFKNMY